VDNLEQLMRKVVEQRHKTEDEVFKKRYNESSKKRLLKILETKFKTSFIGALSSFEESFGHLWGHHKDEADLTPEELEWKKIWDSVRTNVLNNGNNQIRATHNELVNHTITWNRYEIKLKPGSRYKEEKDGEERNNTE